MNKIFPDSCGTRALIAIGVSTFIVGVALAIISGAHSWDSPFPLMRDWFQEHTGIAHLASGVAGAYGVLMLNYIFGMKNGPKDEDDTLVFPTDKGPRVCRTLLLTILVGAIFMCITQGNFDMLHLEDRWGLPYLFSAGVGVYISLCLNYIFSMRYLDGSQEITMENIPEAVDQQEGRAPPSARTLIRPAAGMVPSGAAANQQADSVYAPAPAGIRVRSAGMSPVGAATEARLAAQAKNENGNVVVV